MNQKKLGLFVAILMTVSAGALLAGWREFWFLTDDAYIAFRYVSNSILGYGYTWNPPPFRAVEGYTSFLWIVILESIWRVFDIIPPKSANSISLGFSFLTVALTAFAMFRLKLNERLEKYRFLLVITAVVGLLTNRTFLTWTSSGLETALFNFCFFLWIVVLIFSRTKGNLWRFGLTGAAALAYLSRPDGMLIVGATVLLLLISCLSEFRRRKPDYKWFLSIMPLAIPFVHVIWRLSYYGEWLPNTYYAKHVEAWPESGIRYLASFILEYGLWVWAVVLIAATISGLIRFCVGQNNFLKRIGVSLRILWTEGDDHPNRQMCTAVAVVTVLMHVGYYTFIIGGDHFEWRVYSHLIPLIYISFFYFLSSLSYGARRVFAAFLLLLAFSMPISWTHYLSTRNITELKVEDVLIEPVRDKLPSAIFWLTVPFDDLQKWLIEHHVCVRRQEHRLFWLHQLSVYPDRIENLPAEAGEYPVGYFTTVGVPGWILPKAAIIDGYGLNDYIIARHEPVSREKRLMAHDRYPPENYVNSFAPNIWRSGEQNMKISRRAPEYELTAEKIIALEKYWEDKIVRGTY